MDNFRDYIQYLLPAILKRNKKTNQLLIFCKVIGLVFDDVKAALFRLRLESMLETCSDCMLEVAGQDRDMNQLLGESYDAYRKRLMMKAKIAQMAGTLRGIQYAIESVGYDNCSIEPLYKIDAERWAEININFLTDSVDDDNTIDFRCIISEVMKVKQASTLPHYVFYYPTVINNVETITLSKVIVSYISNFYSDALYLDGSWVLNGIQTLSSTMSPMMTSVINRCGVTEQESVSVNLTIAYNLWYLDGSSVLDGSKNINAYIKEMEL